MDGGKLYSIGDLARRTGLTVKTVRFYSDAGIVPPASRSSAGYRLYAADAVARLDLVRTLRDLGLALSTIRKVVDRQVPLAETLEAHAEALDVQIRMLRSRRAVLTAMAGRDGTPEELEFMHRLVGLSESERQHMVQDFLDTVFDGLRDHPAFAAVTRSMTPELPDSPEPEQVAAWADLAELMQDPDFRRSMHGMALDLASDRAWGGATGIPPVLAEAIRAKVTPALKAGVSPTSPRAASVIEAVAAHYTHILGRPGPADDTEVLQRLLARIESMDDPRRDRYLSLLAVINGWPEPESLGPALAWSAKALRARMPC